MLMAVVRSAEAQLNAAPLGSCGPLQQAKPFSTILRSDPDTLSLPFIEDFSYNGPRADPSKWIDGGVFINTDFPVNPPSWGVATFDGLTAAGWPYSNQLSHGSADTLTSQPIDLSYPPADSIYLSFSLQPKGRGNYPEFIDTFLLEFKTPADTSWRWAWSSKGEDFPQLEKPFRKIMIPIRDTSYLKKGFQFRFRNYAQLNGGWDHWHLDYIRLDKNRYRSDTLLIDYGFMYRGKSLLKVYQSIPLSHFLVAPVSRMSETFNMSLVNNTIAPLTRFYGYDFYNQFGQQVDFLSNKTKGPIPPSSEFVITEPTKYTYQNPGPGYAFATFNLFHQLNDNVGDVIPRNDTASYFQVLSNYYALDDGTAEERIGLENELGGFVAQRFETYKSDTLKAIQYYFNAVKDGVIDRPFYLAVWAAGNNQPGELLYSMGPIQPLEQGWNRFATYALDEPLFLPAGSYYFGWIQENGSSLNLGFDRNIKSNDRIYYNHTGAWFNYTAQEGTLMLRPMFQKAEDTYVSLQEYETESQQVLLYPNPANDKLFLKAKMNRRMTVEIFDNTGRNVFTARSIDPDQPLDIHDLDAGLYVVQVSDKFNSRSIPLSVIRP
jgi:hypothetical protein